MNNVAFIVACEEYENMYNLHGVNNDAELLKNVLVENCSCKTENVFMCTCDSSTPYTPNNPTSITSMITEVAKKYKYSSLFDIIFFYFSGHGYNKNGNQFFILRETQFHLGYNSVVGELSVNTVIQQLRYSNLSNNIIIILDMCQEEVDAIDVNQTAGIVIFNSCSPGSESYISSDNSGSIFTKSLIDALGRNSKCVTVADIHSYIQDKIEDLCNENERRQHPQISLQDLDSANVVITNNARQSKKIINDDNSYYFTFFKNDLFLEHRLESNKSATLEDVYIDPMLYLGEKNLTNDAFFDWCISSDNKELKSVVVLLGKAGVGKTSFVSDIIKKITIRNNSKRNVYSIMLRNHVKEIDKIIHADDMCSTFYPISAWDILKKLLQGYDNDFANSLIVLDGLDELCVLMQGFDAYSFLNDLLNSIPIEINIKILITSRDGYFECPTHKDLCKVELTWDDSCVEKWCEKYKAVQSLRIDWCNQFPEKYKYFNNQTIKEIISCPIILYMMCFSEIELSNEISRARIYNQVFGNIGNREHDCRNKGYFKNDATYTKFKKFIKEISYMISINDGSYLNFHSLDVCVDIIKHAESKIVDNYNDFQFEKEKVKFFGMFYFASESDSSQYALQVAHRSVFEYFTALKICEDYLGDEDFSFDFTKQSNFWNNLFRAFRYKVLEYSVFNFIVDIIKCKNKYSEFQNGMCRLFCDTISDEDLLKSTYIENEYHTKEKLYNQIDIAFSNIFQLLEELDFYNWTQHIVENSEEEILSKNIEYLKYLLKHFSIYSSIYIRPQILYLNNVNFGTGDMSGANLSLAVLNGANLSNIILDNVSLSNAVLRNANISKISNSDLYSADLRAITHIDMSIEFVNCDLREANLQDNCLNMMKFTECDLNCVHISSSQLNQFVECIGNSEVDFIYIDENDVPDSIDDLISK